MKLGLLIFGFLLWSSLPAHAELGTEVKTLLVSLVSSVDASSRLIVQEIKRQAKYPDDPRNDAICLHVGEYMESLYRLNQLVRLFEKEMPPGASALLAKFNASMSPHGFCENLFNLDPTKILKRKDTQSLEKLMVELKPHLADLTVVFKD